MQSAPFHYPRVFLSYSAEDDAVARRLQQDLAEAGAVVYNVASSTGENRGEVARFAIEQSDWMVVVLSPAAIESRWVQADVSLASERINLQKPRGVLLFVAQPYDAAALPPQWGTLERIDATHGYENGLAGLLARLGLRATTQSQPAAEPDTEHPSDTGRGWSGTPPASAPSAEPDTHMATEGGWDGGAQGASAPDRESKREAKEAEQASAPATPALDEERTAAVAPAPAWDADEIVRGWDDTPTVLAPRPAETHATEATPPPPAAPPAAPPSAASSWADDIRVAGVLHPPAPPPPAPPSPAPPPPAAQPPAPYPPTYSPPPPPGPAPSQPAGQPAPGGFPPPVYPPAQPYPPAPSYPPQPGYAPPAYAPPPAYGAPPNPMAPAPQGGYGYPGPFAPQQAPVAVAEQVTFTAYHLREIAPQVWEPLYVYISLDTPQALAQMQATAQQVLAGRMGEFRPAMAAETSWLRRGTQLTFVPGVPGCVFNPPELTVPWQADVQQLAFGMQAVTARPGFAVNGSVQVFTGPLLRADIPISFFVRQPGVYAQAPQQVRNFASITARAYRKVFASYSHRDTAVVQSCETAAQVTGDRYLRDVTMLRSGEQWNDRLLQAIGEADLFQLFWSENAARSPAVQTEWRHALALQPGRGNFIRPVYWSRQLYPIPPELQPIHFERLSLARLGWGKARIFLHDALGLG